MKDLIEEVDREKVGREEVVKMAKEKTKTAEAAKKRATAVEKSRALVELVTQQNETEVKLSKAANLNATLSEEVADLREALEACKSKWYDKGFVDAEKGVEPVVMQARQLSFQEGWMAALKALGVPKDSLLGILAESPF